MENYTLPKRFYPYFPNGFTTEDFGAGRRISTLTGCDLYVYKHELEVRAAILFGVLFPADCQDITRGLNIMRAAARVVSAVIQEADPQKIKAVTVETLIESAWSDGGKAFNRFYEEIGNPEAVRTYQGIVTGDGSEDVSSAVFIDQGRRPLDTFVGQYLDILVATTKKSTYCELGMGTENYRLRIKEMRERIHAETGIGRVSSKFYGEINGYNEQLHLAGLSRISDFDYVSRKLAEKKATASSDTRQVS
ncbi:hypothetical protein HZA99_04920 [Candidatus Woesearchaeota archaeon]|nr:hypothetical protein [Candidatus Woesearchaeota archaeon]